MYTLTNITTLLSISFAIGCRVAAAPLCPETTEIAGGGTPNSGPPPVISEAAIPELQLAYFLKNLETSFFNAGLENATKWNTNGLPNDTVEVIRKIAAQEEVHLSSLAEILDFYNAPLIPPCRYSFPVRSSKEFLELGHAITSVSIGATIGLNERLAVTDPLLVKLLSSIMTVEARHDAILQHIQNDAPMQVPFDTGISNLWAYNLAFSFITPGSCSVDLPIPILPRLVVSRSSRVDTANGTRNDQREFTWDSTQTPFVTEAGKQLLIAWVNQLDQPEYTPLNITSKGRGIVTVPKGMEGVVLAAVTVQQPDNANDLALATLAGPVVLSMH